MYEITMDCEFCAEFRGDDTPVLISLRNSGISNRIIIHKDNVVSFVGLGPLTLGYCLISPQQHYRCLADTPSEVLFEIDRQRRMLSGVIRRIHGAVTCFEHGSRDEQFGGGACYDHAHLHLIGGDPELRAAANTKYPEHSVKGLADLPAACLELTEYLFLLLDDGSSFAYRTSHNVPCQFFRRRWAESLGLGDHDYDWALVPNFDLMRQSVDFLKAAISDTASN